VEPKLPRSAGNDRQAPRRALSPDGFDLAVFPVDTAVYDEFDRKAGWCKTQSEGTSAGLAVYDATNPEARKQYWANANTALFQKAWTPGGWNR